MSAKFISKSKLPTQWGDFAIYVFVETVTQKEHVALIFGKIDPDQPTLCRIHSECLTGDALFSLRCDCGSQLKEAMSRIAEHGAGIILYLRQEGRDIGLANKIKAYALQDEGADTVEANQALGFNADERSYEMCQDMFEYFDITEIELMTNNPRKIEAIQSLGIKLATRMAIVTGENSHNKSYLATKRSKLGHIE